MKTIKYLFLCICLLCTQLLVAQKNAPVTGDAAQLVDLLKKDYGAIDPSTRDEEIVKDRALVIATFKTYLTAEQLKVLIGKTPPDEYVTLLNEYKLAQQQLASFTNVAPPSTVNLTGYKNLIEGLNITVDTTKKKYYDKRSLIDSIDLKNLEDIYAMDNDNQYVKYVVHLFSTKYEDVHAGKIDPFSKNNPGASVQKGIPFIGGDMGFEMVIEGLSKFLAKRIKEELTTYVIEQVKDWLQDPKQDYALAELKVLLPRTYTYLIQFNANQITNFPNEIKQYIEDDFNHLLENMGGLRNTPRIQSLIARYPDIDFALEALELIPSLTKIKNPVDYFDFLENSRNIQRWSESDNIIKYNIANAIKLSAMLAHSFTIIENGQSRLAGIDFISTYSADINFYFLYTGFLHQQNLKYYDIQFIIQTDIEIVKVNEVLAIGETSEKDKFKYPLRNGLYALVKNDPAVLLGNFESIKKQRNFFQGLFMQISENAEKVYVSAQEIKKANKTGVSIGADTAYTFIKSVIDLAEEVTFAGDTLINYFLGEINLLNKKISGIKIDYSDKYLKFIITTGGNKSIPKIPLKEKAAPYFTIANTTNEVLLDLHKKRYSTAIIKALEAMYKLVPEHTARTFASLENVMELSVQLSDISKHWSKVVEKIDAGTSFHPRLRMKASDRFVVDELTKINSYYLSKEDVDINTANAMAILITHIQMMCKKGKVKFTEEDSIIIQSLLERQSFRNLVLSYYLKQDIDELTDNLETELLKLKIKNQSKNIFSEAEVKALKESLNNYLDAAFQYLMDHNKDDFDAASIKFEKTATAILLRIPEKFDFHINEQVLHLIHFVNDMALAQNSDDIEKAIEAFALPAGSYSIKRESVFNVSINSFPGILPAAELTWKDKVCYGNYSMGFTAPVGLSFAWGSRKGFSQGIFVPVLDIGAVTRMQLTNNGDTDSLKASTLPEFNFMSVFAPGVYYHIGFPKTPLSLNIGGQYGPGLRQIGTNGETTVYESVRLGAALVIDIPLLNLHTRPRFKR